MKIAFPLSLKVSLWLLLNLFLVGAVGAAFIFAQVGLGWESFVSGPACDRLQALGEVIAAELEGNSSRDPTEVLSRFGTVYGVDLHLFRANGRPIAGDPLTVPAEVEARLTLPRPPLDFFPPPGQPPPGERALSGRDTGISGLPPEDLAPRRPPPPPGERRRFLQRTSNPTRYWIGVPIPNLHQPHGLPGPLMLVADTPSLFASGLILDLKPWLIAVGGAALFSVLFWLPVVRGVTRSLSRLTAATELIAEGRFETRVTMDRRDELGRLGEAVNTMAQRLDGFVAGQKRFLGDVAHELGSPIARLQFSTSILEQRADASLAPAIVDLREEVEQMSKLVTELLDFTKAELSPRAKPLQVVQLAPLVARVLEREAAQERVVMSVSASVNVLAEPELLSRALSNLIRNALRYAGPNTPIELNAVRENNNVLLTVADEGPGVPADALTRLGEPFYRPETARTRETGGVGLGLAIVKGAIIACHGTVRFDNRTPHGLVVELRIHGA